MATANPKGIPDCERRIIERGLRNGLPRAQIARLANVSPPTVSKVARIVAESQAKPPRK